STSTSPLACSPLSLHDALPISEHRPHQQVLRSGKDRRRHGGGPLWEADQARLRLRLLRPLRPPLSLPCGPVGPHEGDRGIFWQIDRKSTRLNSSHVSISYAVFC